MNKTTAELIQLIKNATNIKDFLIKGKSDFNSKMFQSELEHLSKGISRQELIEKSYLNQSYVYDIFNAKKKPSRDTVIKLGFALSIEINELNRLLKLAGYGELYPRYERDAIIIFCLNNKYNLETADEILTQNKENSLISSKRL